MDSEDPPEGPAPSDARKIPVLVTIPPAPCDDVPASKSEELIVLGTRVALRRSSFLDDPEIQSRLVE
jgi:hypothetical protein